MKTPKLKALKRRRSLGRRLRREVRSIRRWTTLFLVLWGYFKLNEKPGAPGEPPAPSQPSP